MIALGCDHGGYELLQEVKAHLDKRGLEYKDFGTYSTDSVDYPDYASKVARAVQSGECECGIIICGTGIGVSITANRHPGIRAALCATELQARLAREHNNANVLCLGARIIGDELARAITDAFLDGHFAGGRHQRRLDRINLPA